ncbi:MAG: tetratricopeptide repeat protein [Proteobacteria bacterium]|nr:tetratricopeptide repeat protein [Pseudomonadota bacterium]
MSQMGRYRLGELLGTGGQGKVYAATLEGPGGFRKPVALKVLKKQDVSLRREARMGGLLRHRHLVDIYEVGEVNGEWFCAMELCEGSLASQAPMPPRAVVEVGLQVCDALSYAHRELGLVHLDLKPDNLLHAGGIVKVADLGIARAQGFQTEEGVRGTPGFMAPEQRFGGHVDARADVYALGVTLMQLATGFRRTATATWVDVETLATVEDAATTDSPLLTARGPDWLWPVLVRALETDPADRFASMAELALALEALPVDGVDLAGALGTVRTVGIEASDVSLPVRDDSFLGRDVDRRRLTEALSRGCLVTLLGPAGVGKTRLSVEVAKDCGLDVVFCDLSQARTAAAMLFVTARALDVSLSHRDARRQLGRALAARGEVVLVLDNFEQLSDEAAAVVAQLHHLAPGARIVVTSRVPLGVASEELIRIDPLAVEAATTLLADRAALRGVDVRDHPLLAELATRLEGLPLAIELAAGRLGVLSIEDVLGRLGLGLLRSASDDRHGTLRSALDWSWDLLSPRERTGLAELSVFAGSWSIEAAEQTLSESAGVLDLLQSLVEHSVVRSVGDARFGMLVSVREYAGEQLDDDGAAAMRHGRFYAERWTPDEIIGVESRGGQVRQQIDAELANVRSAVERAIQRGDGPTAAAALRVVWTVLSNQGPFDDALELAGRVVAIENLSERDQASVWLIVGRTRSLTGDAARAILDYERAGALARRIGDRHIEGVALNNMATGRIESGHITEAEVLFRKALALHRQEGSVRGQGVALSDLGVAVQQQGRIDEARGILESALRVTRRAHDTATEGVVLSNLGVLHMERGSLDLARSYYEAAVEIQHLLRRWRSKAISLGNLGLVFARDGRLDAARPILEQSLATHRALGNRRFQGVTLGNLGILHHMQGRGSEALHALLEARALAEAASDRRFEGYWYAWLARIQPDHPEVDGWLDRGEALLRAVADPATLSELLAIRVEVLCKRGELQAAAAQLEEAEKLVPPGHSDAHAEIERVRAILQERLK